MNADTLTSDAAGRDALTPGCAKALAMHAYVYGAGSGDDNVRALARYVLRTLPIVGDAERPRDEASVEPGRLDMGYERKLAAINELARAELAMPSPGNWRIVHPGVEVKNGLILSSPDVRGESPEGAVNAYWALLTGLPAGQYIVVNASSPLRRAARWSGQAWLEVTENLSGSPAPRVPA